MADFVREDAGDFGLVLGDKQDALDVEETSVYGEGVYLFGVVDDFDFVFNVGAVLRAFFIRGVATRWMLVCRRRSGWIFSLASISAANFVPRFISVSSLIRACPN